jgi:hypothetical protein
MGSATQKAKPRPEAASEPGGKRVSNSCLGFSKNSKKACHSFALPINPEAHHPRKRESVDAVFGILATSDVPHSKSIHMISQLHEKEIRFTIRLL